MSDRAELPVAAPLTIGVLGPGGVGGFLTAALERSGVGVTVVAREETVQALNRDGLSLTSVRLGEVRVRPRAVARLEDPVDVLVIATKATGLESSLTRIACAPRMVVPLLNGLDHLAVLRERYGRAVIAGTIRIESDRPEPGRIVHTSPFLRVDLAGSEATQRDALARLAATLERAEVPTRVLDSEAQVLWAKLVRLNALACTTSASELRLGEIRSDPRWRARLEAAVQEGARVARAEGADLEAGTVMAELEAAHPTLNSSMARDLVAGREPELDAIAGAVLRAAARHGIPCPAIEELAAQIALRFGVPAPAG